MESRGVPRLRPASTAEVAAVVRLCAGAGVPVVPQGGLTGLAGASYMLYALLWRSL